MALLDDINQDILLNRVKLKLGKFDTSDPEVIAWIQDKVSKANALPEGLKAQIYALLGGYLPSGGTLTGEVITQ